MPETATPQASPGVSTLPTIWGLAGFVDVDHLETGTSFRDVGVGARDGHALGLARRVHAAHPMQVVSVVDALSYCRQGQRQD